MTDVRSPATPDRATGQRPRPGLRRVLVGCLGGTAAAAFVLLGYGALAVAVHGPMQAGDPGGAEAAPVDAASFSIGVLFSCVFGTLLALAVARWAARPPRTFLQVAVALTLLSLAAPLAASHTDTDTRMWLAGGHVLAALIVVPSVVRALRTPLD
jgi:peptidoglycan/LPS O-acetylase OafA/YrhL